MDREFNLIDEPWICVRDNGCEVKEISIRQVFEHAQDYTELAGETKTQDMAVLRFLLAVIYTVFSRYDKNGDEVDPEDDINYLTDNWNEVFRSGKFPMKPFEKYFEKWYDRFWLFDEEYPFYQSNKVNGKGKATSIAKMIGSLFESANKPRLFSDRNNDGRLLSYSEAVRWLLHIICFDDTAAKQPVPKKSWVSILGLIAVRGNNLFETLMLNYNAESDSEYDVYVSTPSWEKDNNKAEFNTLIPVPDNQAALLSLMSRRVYLCRENGKVNGYYISGGDYFEEVEVFGEQMTLWRSYKEKGSDSIKYKPQLHKPSTKAWQEFGSIAALEGDENSSTARKPGVIAHIESYIDRSYLDNCFLLNVTTASVIHDFNDSMCFKIVDSISDELSFHSDLLMKVGEAWRYRIGNEIGKCESAAKAVNKLSINLQKSAGASGDKLSGEDAKTQFYSMIDKPFRDWLSQLDTSYDIDEYTGKIEDTVRKIAIVFGNDCVHQMSANTIFGRYEKDGKDKNLVTTVEALNIFNATINKIFRKEGDNK